MDKQFYVYILASRKYGALYIGVSSDLIGRVYTHREELVRGHTSRYHIHKLVHFEVFGEAELAIVREKQLKKWLRAWKVRLIEENNPEWDDLYPELAAGG
jgi:putative endonuclease